MTCSDFVNALKMLICFEKHPVSRANYCYTKQDAREAMRVVFSVLTKRICMHKTNFLRIYSNIVSKVILICKLQLS